MGAFLLGVSQLCNLSTSKFKAPLPLPRLFREPASQPAPIPCAISMLYFALAFITAGTDGWAWTRALCFQIDQLIWWQLRGQVQAKGNEPLQGSERETGPSHGSARAAQVCKNLLPPPHRSLQCGTRVQAASTEPRAVYKQGGWRSSLPGTCPLCVGDGRPGIRPRGRCQRPGYRWCNAQVSLM